jgi:hypothetical protein
MKHRRSSLASSELTKSARSSVASSLGTGGRSAVAALVSELPLPSDSPRTAPRRTVHVHAQQAAAKAAPDSQVG